MTRYVGYVSEVVATPKARPWPCLPQPARPGTGIYGLTWQRGSTGGNVSHTGGVAECANTATTPKATARRNVSMPCVERYRITVRPCETVRLPRPPDDDQGETRAVSLSGPDAELSHVRTELLRLGYGAWHVARNPVDGSLQAVKPGTGKTITGTSKQIIARVIVSDGDDALGNPVRRVPGATDPRD